MLRPRAPAISIHALREEGDESGLPTAEDYLISIHALREEGDGAWSKCNAVCSHDFYPRPPRGGRHEVERLRAEAADFYPRPPRGGRPTSCNGTSGSRRFLSTPSARRATTRQAGLMQKATYFYPRPPRGGRLCGMPYGTQPETISIHALREEGDHRQLATGQPLHIFLSTPSARRATCARSKSLYSSTISIHALREEGDAGALPSQSTEIHFYPRPPRGGRPATAATATAATDFYPRPPRGGRLEYADEIAAYEEISIHALREEGDSKNRDKISIFKQIVQHSARI